MSLPLLGNPLGFATTPATGTIGIFQTNDSINWRTSTGTMWPSTFTDQIFPRDPGQEVQFISMVKPKQPDIPMAPDTKKRRIILRD